MGNKCTELSFVAPVFLEGESEENFLIEAYTGALLERWWGDLAIDVSGIAAKQNIPILLNHDTSQIVGFSQKAYTEKNSFFVNGKFSEVTAAAKEAKGLSIEGFPWQASVGIRPIKTMSLEKDGETTVNGLKINGPAEIWLESEVFETSFVPLGADSNTKITTFERIKEIEKPQPKEERIMDITRESLGKEAPDLLKAICDEAMVKGAATELSRIKDVMGSGLPGHDALIEKLAFDGKTTGAEAAQQVILAERSLRANAEENLKADNILPVPHVVPPVIEALEEKEITKDGFEKSKELKAEFGDWETFEAYNSAMDTGIVKVISNGGKK